jgi:hypothetical protein
MQIPEIQGSYGRIREIREIREITGGYGKKREESN